MIRFPRRNCVICGKEMLWNKENLLYECPNPTHKYTNIFDKAESEEGNKNGRKKMKDRKEFQWSNTQIGLYLVGGISFLYVGITRISGDFLYILGIIFGIFFIFASLGAIHGRMKK
jgi:hypothetical protein